MSKRTMQEIKEDLNKNAEELAEIEEEIDDLEYELDHTKYKQEDLEETREMLLEELYNSYPILSFTDETREDISGQFERNGKWKLCNGYTLIESENKFADLKESKGIETTIESLTKGNEEITADITDFCEENTIHQSNESNTIYKIKGYSFSKVFADRIINFIGKENIDTIALFKQPMVSGAKAAHLVFTTKGLQALLLGIRTME